jgi:2-amino-4-hydroxy-6-hydroxymethyldihydropteridine diphosphokinase
VRRAYLSLGSNVGDRALHLARGVEIVSRDDSFRLSRVYETEPLGGVPQDDFWNLVIELLTNATARELLERSHEAERAERRVRDVRWGPRTLDVDVLLVGDEVSDDPEVLVVMVPLAELAPGLLSPAQLEGGAGRVVALGTLESLR